MRQRGGGDFPGFRVQFDEGELGGAVDGHEQVELALRRLNLSNINMEVTERVGLEPLLGGLVALDLGQATDVVARAASGAGMTGSDAGSSAAGHRGVLRYKRSPGSFALRSNSSGKSVCLRNATMMASSSTFSTVDLASFGPVGRSATEVRLRHFATVFWFVGKTIHWIVF